MTSDEIKEFVISCTYSGALYDQLVDIGRRIFDNFSPHLNQLEKTQLNEELKAIIEPVEKKLSSMSSNAFGVRDIGSKLAEELAKFVEEKNEQYGLNASVRPR